MNIINKLVVVATFILSIVAFSPKVNATDYSWLQHWTKTYSWGYVDDQESFVTYMTYSCPLPWSTPSYTTNIKHFDANGVLVSNDTYYSSFSTPYQNYSWFNWSEIVWTESSSHSTLGIINDAEPDTFIVSVVAREVDYEGNDLGTFFEFVEVPLAANTQVAGSFVSGNYRDGSVGVYHKKK